jgi:hypothetical protein
MCNEQSVSELERSGYMRLSDPIASYAFHVHPTGVSLLNLHWLMDVIQHYEASERRLADIPTEQGQLDHLCEVAQHVDDDRMAWFIRSRETEIGVTGDG